MSTDLDDLIRRDDDLYDLQGAKDETRFANGARAQSLAGKLDALAGSNPNMEATTGPEEERIPPHDEARDLAARNAQAMNGAPVKPIAPYDPQIVCKAFTEAAAAANDIGALRAAWDTHIDVLGDNVLSSDKADWEKLNEARRVEIDKSEQASIGNNP